VLKIEKVQLRHTNRVTDATGNPTHVSAAAGAVYGVMAANKG